MVRGFACGLRVEHATRVLFSATRRGHCWAAAFAKLTA